MNQFWIMVKPDMDSRAGFSQKGISDGEEYRLAFLKIFRKMDDEGVSDLASNSGTPWESRTPGARFRNT
jgi:hypothetical protein